MKATTVELELRRDFENWCYKNNIEILWSEKDRCYQGVTAKVLKAWARTHDFLLINEKNKKALLESCVSLVKEKPYTFRCEHAPVFGLPTYNILFNEENICKVTIDANSIERIISLLNGAYVMGVSDSCSIINSSRLFNSGDE